jgi:hypothetical protein
MAKMQVQIEGMLHLELDVREPNVIKYLSFYEEPERSEKALEALNVGVIAIQSASPTLDTSVVESKFKKVEESINTCLTEFEDDLKGKLEEHFKPESGSVPRSLDRAFGEQGTVSRLFDDYFGPDKGKIMTLLQRQIGPGSDFSNSLDPKNQESVVYQIQNKVKTELDTKLNTLLDEFSLDQDSSAINRLKKLVEKEVGKIKEDNQQFFDKLAKALGIELGKEMEAAKSPEKGRRFESRVYDNCVSDIGRQLGDITQNMTAVVGLLKRSKKGDFVIILGEDSGAPGKKIVIEAKNDKSYKMKDAIEYLQAAKMNRGAEAGIFAFEKSCAPIEIGDFHRIGEDFYVTIDEDMLNKRQPLLFLETAYKICRMLLITSLRSVISEELDVTKVQDELHHLVELTKRFSEMKTKAETIRNNSDFIINNSDAIKQEMENRLAAIMGMLGQGSFVSGAGVVAISKEQN